MRATLGPPAAAVIGRPEALVFATCKGAPDRHSDGGERLMRVRFSVIVAAVLAASTAVADEQAIRAAFAAADVNGDGQVGPNEYADYFRGVFADLDANGDGHLDAAEAPGDDEARFMRVDLDANGRISSSEAVAERMRVFDQVDADRSGALSMEEVLAYQASRT
jgi:Ca2+-binding EF-hand superfamily protein